MLKYQDLKENFEYPDAKEVSYKDEAIFVKQYLPSEKKYEIIYICVMSLNLNEQSYNVFLAEILFDIQVVKTYTNIIFEEEDEDSYFKQFDVMHNLGIVELVINNIPQEEYEELQRAYYSVIEEMVKYNSSIANALGSLIEKFEDLKEVDTAQLSEGMKMVQELSKDNHI